MTMLETVRDQANAKAASQNSPLQGKFSLTDENDPKHLSMSMLPKATLHLGAVDPSVDLDDSGVGCEQEMIVMVHCWLVCDVSDLYELILHCNKSILGIQHDTYSTELILRSGYLKEINGKKAWYDLTYQFSTRTRSVT